MVVPHHGQTVRSLRIPIKWLKWTGAAVAVSVLTFAGMFFHYQLTTKAAQHDKMELSHLRQVNGTQAQQIEQLAKATAVLQEDMERLNTLDSELRRMINSEESAQTSRSGVNRLSSGQPGQGGPVRKPEADELIRLVQDMQTSAKAREQSLHALKDAIADKKARFAATPSIWPASGEVSSRYGWRWGYDWHPGIDIADDWGSPILAAADGVVVFSDWYSGYGKMIQIDHGNGIVTLYAHNAAHHVSVGQSVQKGQHIADMGSTGYSTGPHLHYEVRVNGSAVNPANFL